MPRGKAHVSVRMPLQLRARLERSAQISHRTLSGQIVWLLSQALRDVEAERPGRDDTTMRGHTRL